MEMIACEDGKSVKYAHGRRQTRQDRDVNGLCNSSPSHENGSVSLLCKNE